MSFGYDTTQVDVAQVGVIIFTIQLSDESDWFKLAFQIGLKDALII